MSGSVPERSFTWVKTKPENRPIEVETTSLRNVQELIVKVKEATKPALDNISLEDIGVSNGSSQLELDSLIPCAKKGDALCLVLPHERQTVWWDNKTLASWTTETTLFSWLSYPLNLFQRVSGPKAPPFAQIPEADICNDFDSRRFVGRDLTVSEVRDYLQGVRRPSGGSWQDDKLTMLGCSGIKGIGKTAMLMHIAKILSPDMGNVKALYMTFNGGFGLTNSFYRALSKSRSGVLADAFATTLLVRCGVKEDAAVNASFNQTIQWIRQVQSCEEDDILLICVDEIGDLCRRDSAPNMPADTMSSVMHEVDKFKGQVVFIFSHIEDSVLTKGASGSGRPVRSLQLPALPLDAWKELPQLHDWQAAASTKPAIHQLLLACCGHPRCLVDGLPAALRKRPHLLTKPTDAALVAARQIIIQTCKFNDIEADYLEKVIYKWFSFHEHSKLNAAEMIANGLLLKLPNDVELLNPLLLQHWTSSSKEWASGGMRFHLSQVYDADAVLGHDTEKRLEDVMFNYEAVRRICLNEKPIALRDFYDGGHVGSDVAAKLVTARLPSPSNIVMHVDDFQQNMDDVLKLLRSGWIVVSDNRQEPGVEFLSPYMEVGSDKLLVATVQCKYVPGNGGWSAISQKMKAIQDLLKSKGAEVFPVVYATPDQTTIQERTYKNGVYFTQSGIFHFTKRLGILRLHVMKLGTVLKNQYPWLEGSQVEESQQVDETQVQEM